MLRVLCLQSEREVPAYATKLHIAAFEAINSLISSASQDTLSLVEQLLPLVLSKLAATVAVPVESVEDRDRVAEHQYQLCGAYCRARSPAERSTFCPEHIVLTLCVVRSDVASHHPEAQRRPY
jgi:hypothetical protein